MPDSRFCTYLPLQCHVDASFKLKWRDEENFNDIRFAHKLQDFKVLTKPL